MTTFVLVPGAWLGGWVWKKVLPLLNEKGHQGYAVTLTGTGDRAHLLSERISVETAVQDVLNVIEFNDLEDFVLAGHSFAGKVVAAVADRTGRKVRKLLFVDAYRPDKVRTPQGSFAGEWKADGSKINFPKGILDSVGKDVQGADREWLLSKATPLPVRYFSDPVTLSENFDKVTKAYILCTGGGDPVNEVLEGKWGKLEGPHRVIESGHWPMITKPEELTDDMVALADSGS